MAKTRIHELWTVEGTHPGFRYIAKCGETRVKNTGVMVRSDDFSQLTMTPPEYLNGYQICPECDS